MSHKTAAAVSIVVGMQRVPVVNCPIRITDGQQAPATDMCSQAQSVLSRL